MHGAPATSVARSVEMRREFQQPTAVDARAVADVGVSREDISGEEHELRRSTELGQGRARVQFNG